MNEATSAVLQKAYQHIKSGEKQDALAILMPLLRVEPNNAEAWYLLGFALTAPEKRIYAFEQVLRLDPANQPAQDQLAKLRPSPVAVAPSGEQVHVTGAQPKPQRRTPALGWILTGASILLLGLLVAGGGWLVRGIFSAASLPTATPLVLATATPKATVTPRPSVTPYPRRATSTSIPAFMTSTQEGPLAPPPVEMFDIKDMPVDGKNSSVTEMKSAHLDAGAMTSIKLDVDIDNEISFIIRWTGAQPLLVTLNDPNGALMDEAYASAHPEEVVFERSDLIIYRIKKPIIGAWTINLTALDVGDYGVVGRFTKSPLMLSADKNRSYQLNVVGLRATLFDYDVGVTGARVFATMTYPDGSFHTVFMKDATYGRYEADYPAVANVSGMVFVHITAIGKNKGVAFTRSTFFTFLVWDKNVITLTGDYTDRLGKLDGFKTIDVEMGVDVVDACTCQVMGLLKSGRLDMGVAFADVALVAGHNRITLNFMMVSPSLKVIPSLFQNDGPYTLTDLSFRPSANSPISFFAENVWQTAAYRWQEFAK